MAHPIMHYDLLIDGLIAAQFHVRGDNPAALAMAKGEAAKYLGQRAKEIRDSNGLIVWTPTWEAS